MTPLKYLLFLLFIGLSVGLKAQNPNLAYQYYNTGEYEKAAQLFLKLYNDRNVTYYRKYVECLLAMEEYDLAENSITEEIKKRPGDLSMYVTLGNLKERKSDFEGAKKEFKKATDNLPKNRSEIQNLSSAFRDLGKFDLAIETLVKGEKLLGSEGIFARSLVDLYNRAGDTKNLITQNLILGRQNKAYVQSIKITFQRTLDVEGYTELKSQLYQLIQENPQDPYFPEILEWAFIHKKEYKKALRQSIALDRLAEANGLGVMNVGKIAEQDKDYETAINAYKYIVDTYGSLSSLFFVAKKSQLNCYKNQVFENANYTTEDLRTLEGHYESFLTELGMNWRTAEIMMDYAELLAERSNKLPRAIEILNDVVSYNRLDPNILALCKLQLGDYYLMDGNIWEATLLYSQVDKSNKEQEIGEEARYRNARLSYFNGDFEWSQAQYDILKSATSRLISNDAIDQSIFIMDNIGLDTTEVPMQLFASAELLSFQNKDDEAFEKLDSILILFPEHGLTDDIAFVKAQIYKKQHNYELVKPLYELIIKDYKEEIRADNALFDLANLYETVWNDQEKAKELYQNLFLDFSNSTLAVEARKRFRILRGDELQ